MAQQFWVNNYYIDVTRNQIQHQHQSTQLPPRALKVLEVLAERAGEVVSHDELMELVWQKSVVGPNTLQRAIAQLRKAFGDDSKQQAFIKTHAKQGYSLEANVRWDVEVKSQHHSLITHSEQSSSGKRNNKWMYTSAIIIFAISVFYSLTPEKRLYQNLTPLTASDEQEFNASYSPNGQYIAFNRFVGQCESHLWAKNLENNQEVRLSTEPGHYSRLTWSADGTQLAFVMQSKCVDIAQESTQCWQLQTLDFAQAWNREPNNLLRFDCANTETIQPSWLNDGRIATLQYTDPNSRNPEVVIFDPVSARIDKIDIKTQGQIYSLDYSRISEHLALVINAANNKQIVTTLTHEGEVISEAEVKRPDNLSVYERFPISFSPDGRHFLTNVNGQIYRMSLDGVLEDIHPSAIKSLWMPTYHPDQQKIAVTYGPKDFDIGRLTIAEQTTTFDLFSRSTDVEFNPQTQPDGSLVAFVSFRTGDSQIWIADGENTYQLTQFENGITGVLYSWSPDGQRIVTNLNNQLVFVDLDGSYDVLTTTIAVNVIMPWTHSEHLLVTASDTENHQLFDVNLRTGEATYLSLSNIMWASLTEENQLLYGDYQKDFWLQTEDDIQPLPVISKKLSGKSALFKDGFLYGLDFENKLWRYELSTEDFTILTRLDMDITYISDVHTNYFLATKFVGGRRELMELSLE